MSKSLLLLLLFAFYSVECAPRVKREGGAEVIKVVDEKSPILLTAADEYVVAVADLETRNDNSTAVASGGDAPTTQASAPTPVPENVPITTEKLQQNTPSLVPTVVDTGANPGGTPTPPPPANATSSQAPGEEDEEDSEEDGSEEEADEGDEEEEGDGDDEDDEEDDEDADDEEEEDDAAAKGKKNRNAREVSEGGAAAGEEVRLSFKEEGDAEKQQQSEEEDGAAEGVAGSNTKNVVGNVAVVKGGEVGLAGVVGTEDKLLAVVGSQLQSLPSTGVTNEDDEADSVSGSSGSGPRPNTVVIS